MVIKPASYSPRFQPCCFFPVHEVHRFPVEGQVAGTAAIIGLLFIGSPNAVLGRVASVIIFSFDG